MCGIAGFAVGEECTRHVPRESLVAMGRALSHRGPDDEGYLWSPKVGLGSRRLSIIDLSPNARMPLFNEERTVAVIQNGEIYNFRKLRSRLEQRGHIFQSNSDTEVIVHLYEEAGETSCELLEGMYAIAIWDMERRKVILARDRFGEKPLYYYQESGSLAFASELKSLLLCPFFAATADWDALDQFLTLGYILGPRTPYLNTFKLLPGHLLVFDQVSGTTQMKRYWSPPAQEEPVQARQEREYVEEFHRILRQSVENRMVSDVPIGAFLSGGIDSSLVVAAMARFSSEQVRTFSIGFRPSERHNENPIAERVAKRLGVEHNTLWADSKDILSVFDKLPSLWDEPLGDPALISVYLITRFAKDNGVTVMLSGDGGDELFLGYPVYSWVEYLDKLYRLPGVARRGVAGMLSVGSHALDDSRLLKAAHACRQEHLTAAAYYLTGHGAWSLSELGDLRGHGAAVANDSFASSFDGPKNGCSPQRREARALLATYLPDNNLARMDRASMANSVETRAPFLTPGISEFAAKLPGSMMIRGSTLKYLLRKALNDVLPGDVARRPKHGFNALPMSSWLRHELYFLVRQYLDPARLKRQGLYNPDVVEQCVQQHLAGGKFNHWLKLWLLIVLQMWIEHSAQTSNPPDVDDSALLVRTLPS